MSLEPLIHEYGYLAVVIMTFFEGESIVILAGVAAHLGLLELQWVIVAALVGSFSGDQLFYYMGRHWGPKIIARRLSWQVGAEKVYKHLRRHQDLLILTFRFYYGLRNVTPFAVGSAQVPRLRFFVLNLIGAVVWANVFAFCGYLLGETFRLFISDYHRYALYLLGGLVVLGVIVWITMLLRNRKRALEARLEKSIAPLKMPGSPKSD